jgi:hypothetical protein
MEPFSRRDPIQSKKTSHQPNKSSLWPFSFQACTVPSKVICLLQTQQKLNDMTDWLRNLFKQCSKGIWADLYFCTPHIGGALLDLPHFGVCGAGECKTGIRWRASTATRALAHTSVPLPSGAGWETFIAACKWKYPHQFFLISGSENRVCADERLQAGRFFLSQGICKWESYKQVAMAARRNLTVTECAKLPREASCSINATLREWNLVFAQLRCHLI